jgi:hypothetical protein
LAWPRTVVVAGVLANDPSEVVLVQDEDVIETLAAKRSQEALADGVHVGRTDGGLDYPDAGGRAGNARAFARVKPSDGG